MRDWEHKPDRTTVMLRAYLRDIDDSRSEHYPHTDFVELATRIGEAMQAYDEHHLLLARVNGPAKFSRIFPKSECQADPIFLLQSRRWVCLNADNYTYDSEAETLFSTGGVEVDAAYKEECSEDWEAVWEIEGVFLTRDQAQTWGDARHYRWGKHRTYSVSAMGDLAHLLAELTTYWDGVPYKKARHD